MYTLQLENGRVTQSNNNKNNTRPSGRFKENNNIFVASFARNILRMGWVTMERNNQVFIIAKARHWNGV
jgi:hypothetical protein